ncbi:MAG: 5'-methylthioadenosine/adenosylhomocysteine nucleosidase [Erysipelotrichaceae bacterium]|nr:5'-methylthioadenosine/adenosylhomocysteine nucleosidase [Erysipelotrichaceae bacterium]
MIGIIAAMEIERDAILAKMENAEQKDISGISMFTGELGKKPIVLMLSGVGKGNAAMSTTILLENFQLEAVINIGTAGGLLREQNVLDIVISNQVVQHDFDTSGLDQEEGIGLYYQADEQLISECKKAFSSDCYQVFTGLIASGDQFICENEKIETLLATFPKAMCVEMEAGAIAQVCSHYEIPFVVLRSLSDIVYKENSEMDFKEYAKRASERSASCCEQFLYNRK